MKIVAFGHRQGVGKDEAAKLLISQIKSANGKISVQRIGFADSLKELAEQAFGWTGLQSPEFYINHPEWKDRALPTIGRSPREIWLEMGASCNRICPVTFCHLLLRRADAQVVIIPDLRRLAEAEFLEKYPSYLVRVNRPSVRKLEDTLPHDPNRNLDSELEDWPRWYRTLQNTGTLRDLNEQLKPLTAEILSGL